MLGTEAFEETQDDESLVTPPWENLSPRVKSLLGWGGAVVGVVLILAVFRPAPETSTARSLPTPPENERQAELWRNLRRDYRELSLETEEFEDALTQARGRRWLLLANQECLESGCRPLEFLFEIRSAHQARLESQTRFGVIGSGAEEAKEFRQTLDTIQDLDSAIAEAQQNLEGAPRVELSALELIEASQKFEQSVGEFSNSLNFFGGQYEAQN